MSITTLLVFFLLMGLAASFVFLPKIMRKKELTLEEKLMKGILS